MVQKLTKMTSSVLKCDHIEDNFSNNNYLYYFHYIFKKAVHSYQIKQNLKLNFPKKVDLLHSINFIYQGEINDQN